MQHRLPLEETASGRSDRAIVERLPVSPAAHRLLDVARAGKDVVVMRTGLDFDRAEARKRSGIENVTCIFVRLRFAQA